MLRFVLRLVRIVFTLLRYGVDELALSGFREHRIRLLAGVLTLGRRFELPRGVRLRMALERLGPIFIKFGQVLSTRRDLLPLDIADELARLQDRVPPFPPAQARAIIEAELRRPLETVFAQFDDVPVATAFSVTPAHPASASSNISPEHA